MFDTDEGLNDRESPRHEPSSEEDNVPQQHKKIISCQIRQENLIWKEFNDKIVTPKKYQRNFWADCKSEVFQAFNVCKMQYDV